MLQKHHFPILWRWSLSLQNQAVAEISDKLKDKSHDIIPLNHMVCIISTAETDHCLNDEGEVSVVGACKCHKTSSTNELVDSVTVLQVDPANVGELSCVS